MTLFYFKNRIRLKDCSIRINSFTEFVRNPMEKRVKRLLGDGPCPFPIDEIKEESVVEAFIGQGMIVLSSKGSIYIPANLFNTWRYV